MFQQLIESVAYYVCGWPLIIFVLCIGIVCTLLLRGVQFRYFFRAWKLILFPPKSETIPVSMPEKERGMTPLQAFINTLSANLGNGSIAGMATAIYSGGPGAALWVLIVGFILMSVRLAEVYLSTYFGAQFPGRVGLGGPMLYLRNIPFGRQLAYIYAILCLILSFLMGNALQTNSIRISVAKTWGFSQATIAITLLLFVWYVVAGGAARIVKLSAKIVPFKVLLFFSSTIIILFYHASSLLPALELIVRSALCPQAIVGGALGLSVQQAMRFGITRSIFATESGLGTAAILYGSTGSSQAMSVSIMAMLSTFISTLGCFIISLCIVASGLWNSGLTSTALTIAVFETVFGSAAGWMVTFLSVSFGIGVMVVFAYIARETWFFVFGTAKSKLFNMCYCIVAVLGVLGNVNLLWTLCDLLIAVMLLINLFGIVYLIGYVKHGMIEFEKT